MDLLINVVLLVVGFIGALTAIGGETWRKEGSPLARRITRRGFKAGNMNNALALHGGHFAYFAVADADEMLPAEFLSVCISRMRSNRRSSSAWMSRLVAGLSSGAMR